MQQIDIEIATKYKLDLKSIIPYKDFHVVATSRGRKILRKNNLSPERILFIHAAKEYLYNNNFRNLDRYLCTEEGDPYIIFEGAAYTLSDPVEGAECNFDSKADVIGAARLLASMHGASRGFVPPAGSKPRDDLGKLPFYFSKRLEEIKKYRKVAAKGKSRFDYMFLDCFDYYYSLGESALNDLHSSNYAAMVDSAKREGLLCHHDFTHHNIICSQDKMYITGFDYVCFELKIYDIANFIRRKMRKCDWNIADAALIIEEYGKIESLSRDDMEILRIMLQFPQKFWRVINKYYNSRRSWSERNYASKLQEVLDETEKHRKFMERFRMLI